MIRFRLLIVNSILIATLLGSFWGRRFENPQVSKTDFLSPLSLPFHGWKTQDTALSASEFATLQPDATLLRSYASPDGQQIDLAVIAGHRKSSVHTPGFCMVGGGWEILSQEDEILNLGGVPIEATRSVMSNEGRRIVATYFFTDGSFCTRNLIRFQATQLAKRFSSQAPIGALVRIITPMRTTVADAEKLTSDFSNATVPRVLAAVRSAHLQTR